MICAGRCVLERGLGPWSAACRRPSASVLRLGASWGTLAAWQTGANLSARLHASARIGAGPPAPFPDGGGAEKEPGGRESQGPLVTYEDLFEKALGGPRGKPTFDRVLRTFRGRDVRRRGHVEFIYTALRKMPEFGVERELAVYNNLLDVFPKEVFVPRNYIQRMFNHYPRQQECAVQVLEQMENYGVLPNTATKALLVQIFGAKSHPMRKYQRLLYWFPRFRNVNPYPVPEPLPPDPLELARLGLRRIAADLSSEVAVYQMPHTELGPDGCERHLPHVVGIQSPDQRDLLAQHNPQRPVFVEGPFPLWLRRTCVQYYILRSDPLPPEAKAEKTIDPERSLSYPMELTFDLDRDLGDDDELDVDE
ncbi:evolutionarily conserved signaling intermediate in Toll pathway, mitochondrial, partial [Heptranchias perlo]|uniref:evolutionarily conserved signaling intermediate in Toll pathway, mitochondrial n=1 Tax=Heptranchias perlo TaxID=212740 RepID=UPI00355A0304